MKKTALPAIRLDNQRPVGLKFKTSENALALWDKDLQKNDLALNFSAAAAQSVEINILGEIYSEDWGGFSAVSMKKSLASAGKSPVTVLINSPGGDVFEGVAIYNLLRAHPGNVTVRVLGLAASAASVIAMAGDRIEVAEAALIMIHRSSGLVAGNLNDMREFSNTLEAIDTGVAELYSGRTGLPTDEVLSLMEAETWMSAADAVKLGFADIALAEKKPAAKNISHKQFLQQHHPLASASGSHARPMVRMSLNKPAASPGASGITPLNPKGTQMKSTAEQISAFEAKRVAMSERMIAIMNKAAEGERALEVQETEEYDGLAADVASIDAHLVRLRALEAAQLSNATVIQNSAVNADSAAAASARAGTSIISVKANVEKGAKFARYAMAIYQGNGSNEKALAIVQNNKRWMDQTPEVAKVLMAAVAAGDTTTAGWAAELVYNDNLAAEFIEFLRPMTIVGKLQGLRRVPFNVRMGSQTASSTAYWVGQGQPIPVSKPTTSSLSLGITKMAGLVAIDDELMRSSSPSAELLVRDDLAKTISTFMDVQFVDPNVAAVANVNPASMTNGVTAVAATGTNLAAFNTDMATLMGQWGSTEIDASKGVFVMTPNQAMRIGMMLNSLGVRQYPSIDITGGTLNGLPVIVSNSANIPGSPDSGNMILLVNPPEILMADEGGVTVDISNEASIQMLDNPTNASTGGTTATTMVSMFQTHSHALRAVRYVNWVKRRSNAVVYIREAAYAA